MTNNRLLPEKYRIVASEKKKKIHICKKTLVAILKTSNFNCYILCMVVLGPSHVMFKCPIKQIRKTAYILL